MKRFILLALLLTSTLMINKVFAEDDGNRYVVFIGSGEVGDPMITWQKVGDEVKKPSIFTNEILKDETLPMVIIAPEAAAGQIPPGVERLIRNYRQINDEEPVVILLNKETMAKINSSLKTELEELGLVLEDNKISVKTSDQVQPNTLKTRLNNKLSDFPTMGTLLIKDAIQAFACYYLIYLSGAIPDPAAWQIITFISVNLVVTTGINLFIEEFIKVRSAAANVFKTGIDKTFDAVTKTFQNIKDYIGDFREKKNHKKLLRATAARMATDGDISSSKFDGWMRKTAKFLIRGDMAFQTFCVGMPMMFAGWAIWGTPNEAFNFANSYLGMTATGWWTVACAGIGLSIVNSLSGVPLDLTNSYFNKVGVFSNRVSIWLSLVMEGIWQKDKLGQVGSVDFNMIANKLVAYASLPVYLLAHWLSPAANAKDIVVKPEEDKFNEVMNDLNTALNSVSGLTKEAEIMARLQKRERSKLGIGFLDKLFAKPDTQLLLDLTYIMQKYIDDGTFDKAGLTDKAELSYLLESLKMIRDNHNNPQDQNPLSLSTKEENTIISEAEEAVNTARDFNSIKPSFWKECGRTIKKNTIKLLGVFGWKNTETAENNIIATTETKKGTTVLETEELGKGTVEYYLDMANKAETLYEARDFLSKAALVADGDKDLLAKIDAAEISINAVPKNTLIERLKSSSIPEVDILFNENLNKDAAILYMAAYISNTLLGRISSPEMTEITMGTPENNFEDGLISVADRIIAKMPQAEASAAQLTLRKLRLLILCSNDHLNFDGEEVDIVEFLTSEFNTSFSSLFLGKGEGVLEELTENKFNSTLKALDKSLRLEGIERYNRILDGFGIIKK